MNHIEIRNFKKINKLRIDGFKRINLISGCNNSGKSTILEAIYMLTCANDQNTYNLFNSGIITRGAMIHRGFMDVLPNLFYKFDTSLGIKVSSESLGCSINYSYSNSEAQDLFIVNPNMNENSDNDISKISTPSRSVDINYSTRGYDFGVTFIEGGAKLKNPNQNSSYVNKPCSLINENNVIMSGPDGNNQMFMLSNLIKQNKEQEIVKNALKLFDESINSIAIISQPPAGAIITIGVEGYNTKIPLSAFGGGTKKVLNIIMSIMNNAGGVVLVDEIENGIHYSIIPKLWQIIFELTRQYKCQLFATTHSQEYLKYVIDENTNWDEHKNEFTFITLKSYEDEIIPSIRSSDSYERAFENKTELRG